MKDEKNNAGNRNSGNGNSGNRNSGNRNSGDRNSGDRNSGYWNSGYGNSGYWNSGDRNLGYGNSGYWNSGNRNSGDRNLGNRNSGYWNSGNRNSGDRNLGNRNSGDRNSGHCNSGYGNSCNRSSGIFCSEEQKVFLFNRSTDLNWEEINHPSFNKFDLAKWVPESEMTDAEKLEQKDFHVREGYLKTYTWEESWANYWKDSDEEEKQKVLNLPNFCPAIFKKITGIDVGKKVVSCDGRIVEIDGKKYELREIDS